MIGSNQQPTSEKKKYPILPAGQYTFSLEKVEEKQTKAGNGSYLDVTFKIVEGVNAGRLIFEKFHIDNPSAKCVEIGTQRLDKLLSAAGLGDKAYSSNFDTGIVSEALNKLVVGNVKIEEGTNGYSDRNKITSFLVR